VDNKKLKVLLEILRFRSLYVCNSIKTFDFSTSYTSIPHTLLKSRIKELFSGTSQKKKTPKNGEQRHPYLIIGRDKSYSAKSHSKSNDKYKQEEII
jgi:hypothetical protein